MKNTQEISWLEFLAIENRIRALLKMCQNQLPGSKVRIYSLSNNTLWKHWVKKEPEGVTEEGLFEGNDLLLSSKIWLKNSVFDDYCYVRLELFSDGSIACQAYFDFPAKTIFGELLNKVRENEVVVSVEDHIDLFNTIGYVFRVLREIAEGSVTDIFKEPSKEVRKSVDKYLTGHFLGSSVS